MRVLIILSLFIGQLIGQIANAQTIEINFPQLRIQSTNYRTGASQNAKILAYGTKDSFRGFKRTSFLDLENVSVDSPYVVKFKTTSSSDTVRNFNLQGGVSLSDLSTYIIELKALEAILEDASIDADVKLQKRREFLSTTGGILTLIQVSDKQAIVDQLNRPENQQQRVNLFSGSRYHVVTAVITYVQDEDQITELKETIKNSASIKISSTGSDPLFSVGGSNTPGEDGGTSRSRRTEITWSKGAVVGYELSMVKWKSGTTQEDPMVKALPVDEFRVLEGILTKPFRKR